MEELSSRWSEADRPVDDGPRPIDPTVAVPRGSTRSLAPETRAPTTGDRARRTRSRNDRGASERPPARRSVSPLLPATGQPPSLRITRRGGSEHRRRSSWRAVSARKRSSRSASTRRSRSNCARTRGTRDGSWSFCSSVSVRVRLPYVPRPS